MCSLCLTATGVAPLRVLEAARLRSQISRLAFQRRKRQVLDPAERALMLALKRIYRVEAERVTQMLAGVQLPPRAVQEADNRHVARSVDDLMRLMLNGIDLLPYEAALLMSSRAVMPAAMSALLEQLAARSVGVSGELMRFPQAQEWIGKRAIEFSKRYAKTVSETTNKAIRTQLAQGWDAGEGMDKLIARVKNVYASAGDRRAEMIARTESSRAYNTAQLEMGRKLGADKKFWISSGSPYAAVDACGENEAMGKIPVDASFHDNDGNPIDGPPAHVNCLCDIGYDFPEDLEIPFELSEV